MLKELLFQALSGVVTEELKTLLAIFKANNGEDKYNELILSIKNSFLLLKTVTDKTKTKIDDTIVGIILDAVK